MFASLLIVASLGGSGLGNAGEGHCDIVEVNHVCRGGSPNYTQVIFWEWSKHHRRKHIQWWYVVSNADCDPLPQRVGGEWQLRYLRGYTGRPYLVRADVMVETWTGDDLENRNRLLLDVRERKFMFAR